MKSRNFQLRFCPPSLRALRLASALGAAATVGLVLAVGCGGKDAGVSSDPVSEEEESEDPVEGEDGEDGEGNGGGRDGGAGRMDAGNPDDHEIVTIDAPDATCAATTAEAPRVVETKEVVVETTKEEIKPVAIYLMLDRSSSMQLCPNQSPPWLLPAPLSDRPCANEPVDWTPSWSQATGAISAFLSDQASANIDVALGYFPPLVTGADQAMLCSGASCATPAVPMRRAPDNAGHVANSLNGAVPPTSGMLNYTPMECALRGVSAFCKDHTARTQQKCVGVVVTDGTPQRDCDTNQANLIQVAAAAAAEGTPVFALGMKGANFAFLNAVAMAGGTDCTPNAEGNACDVSSGQAAFIAALNAIRETVVVKESHVETHTETKEVPLDCEWNLPEPPEGMKFDREKVNVSFSAEGKDPVTLGRVPTSSDEECQKHPDGWRYDSDDEPKKVLACEKACEMIKSATGAKISIAFGCQGKTLD